LCEGGLGVALGWLRPEILHSVYPPQCCYGGRAFNVLHSLREGGRKPGSGLSRFKIRGSRFEVQDSALDVGCWMLDVGCWMFLPAPFQRFLLPAPARSRFQPFSFQDFSVSVFQHLAFQFLLSAFPISAFPQVPHDAQSSISNLRSDPVPSPQSRLPVGIGCESARCCHGTIENRRQMIGDSRVRLFMGWQLWRP
jgi:hypothetical protein